MAVWLIVLAWISLALAFASAIVIVIDLIGHRQQMWIMNLVWPITALYAGPLALWAYVRGGAVVVAAERTCSEGARPIPAAQAVLAIDRAGRDTVAADARSATSSRKARCCWHN